MQQIKWGLIAGCATTIVAFSASNHNQSTEEERAEGFVQQEMDDPFCIIFGHDPFPDPSDPLWYTRDGALVKEQTAPEVYVVYGGRKWWIPTEQTLCGMNYHWEEVRVVADGTLADLPRENVISDGPVPGVAPTPSSVIWPPGSTGRNSTAAPGTRFLRSLCHDLRLITVRGWIRTVSSSCNWENWGADWHMQIEVDPASLEEIGSNLNAITRASNTIWYDFRPPHSPYASIARPMVDVEINGFAPGLWFSPDDWTLFSDLQPPLPGDCHGSRWAFDPRVIPANPDSLVGKYVRMKGSLLNDDPHFGAAGPEMADALRAWQDGMSRDDPRNQARTAEIHPPDRIEILPDQGQTESVYAVAVCSQNCGPLGNCTERILDTQLYPLPPRPSGPAQATVVEAVDGDNTTFDLLTVANPSRTGAQLTVSHAGDYVQIRVGVLGQSWWGREGHFKAVYRATWGPCTPRTDCSVSCGQDYDGCGGTIYCGECPSCDVCVPSDCPGGCPLYTFCDGFKGGPTCGSCRCNE